MPGPVSESYNPTPLKLKLKVEWARNLKQDGLKFFVLKAEDFLASITETQAIAFNRMLVRHENYRVKRGKPPANDYWIVNRDESYADEVKAVMEKHIGPLKTRKQKGKKT